MSGCLLDSRRAIAKLDTSNALGSIEQLADQVEHVWKHASSCAIPLTHKHSKNIVVSGMGGSALGARLIQSLYTDVLKIPFEVVNEYTLPSYVNENTLVMLSSYSGTTEETVFSGKDAIKKHAKILVLTTGGKLLEFAKSEGLPFYKITPMYNPSNQPRMAIGYSVFAQLALLNSLEIIHVSSEEVADVVKLLRKNAENLSVESTEHNSAKLLAYSAVDKIIMLISAQHLEGAVHVFNNQLNENAKNLTHEMVIPELNHHYMEALSFPKHLKENLVFMFFQSLLYHPRIYARFPLTKEVVEKHGYQAEMIMAVSKTKLMQVWEIIQLGAYTNFYLAMLNGVNPTPNPWVDYFKEKLDNI